MVSILEVYFVHHKIVIKFNEQIRDNYEAMDAHITIIMQGSSFSLSLGDTELGPGPFSDHITFFLFRE